MLFNSIPFLLFFPTVTTVYFLLPHRFRWMWLLAASSAFYMFFRPIYIFILVFTIGVDYLAGRFIEDARGWRRKSWLIASLCANVGVLAFFKYWNFLAGNLNSISSALHWNYQPQLLDILLPIGLSFHTFQAMSYTIEVYRGGQSAERHLGIYALYVMFYPQLVAGPIERPQNLLPQFHQEHAFDVDRLFSGLGRMLWGMFKKVVIADHLAIMVNRVFNHPEDFSSQTGMAYFWATLFFSVQIYCDFSGYSDIASGSARAMGFRLVENFNRPYVAQSVGEFWRRWHISLSTWFRDYVYVPLGGNRVNRWRLCGNLFLVFLVSGLWHGANWTFVVWGALHGGYLISSVLTRGIRQSLIRELRLDRWPNVLSAWRTAVTWGLVGIAWVFFRADTVPDALVILQRMLEGVVYVLAHTREAVHLHQTGIPPFWFKELLYSIALVLFVGAVEAAQMQAPVSELLARKPIWVRWSAYYAMLLMILTVGVLGSESFIYFQF